MMMMKMTMIMIKMNEGDDDHDDVFCIIGVASQPLSIAKNNSNQGGACDLSGVCV